MDDGPGDGRMSRRTGSKSGCSEEGKKKQQGKKGTHTGIEWEAETIPVCFRCEGGVQT